MEVDFLWVFVELLGWVLVLVWLGFLCWFVCSLYVFWFYDWVGWLCLGCWVCRYLYCFGWVFVMDWGLGRYCLEWCCLLVVVVWCLWWVCWVCVVIVCGFWSCWVGRCCFVWCVVVCYVVGGCCCWCGCCCCWCWLGRMCCCDSWFVYVVWIGVVCDWELFNCIYCCGWWGCCFCWRFCCIVLLVWIVWCWVFLILVLWDCFLWLFVVIDCLWIVKWVIVVVVEFVVVVVIGEVVEDG